MDKEKECIFCYENNNDLFQNTICKCKYYYHIECFLNWIDTKNNCNCIICHKNFNIKEFKKSISEQKLINIVDVKYLDNDDYKLYLKTHLKNSIQDDIFYSLNPIELKENLNNEIKIRNILFNIVWDYNDPSLDYIKIGITNTEKSGIIYYRVLKNGKLKSNFKSIDKKNYRHEIDKKKCVIS